jgi:hypothetical protein
MAILALSNQKNKHNGKSALFYCPWRQRQVPALPEELVRVQLLQYLVEKLGYPKSGIAVERELEALVAGNQTDLKLPKRRADIVCFAKGIEGSGELKPLLLIECKSVPLTQRMKNQVIGYNHYLGAPFVALVNQTEVQIGWYEESKGQYCFAAVLPPYSELLALAREWRMFDAKLLCPPRNNNADEKGPH